MSDLISREALLEAIKADRYTNAQDAIFFITNAPTVQTDSADGLGIEPMRAGITITHLFYILNKYNEQLENVDKRSIESSIELIRKQHSIINAPAPTNTEVGESL